MTVTYTMNGKPTDSVRTKTLTAVEQFQVAGRGGDVDAFLARMLRSAWVKKRLEQNGALDYYVPQGTCTVSYDSPAGCLIHSDQGTNRRGNPVRHVRAEVWHNVSVHDHTYMDALHTVAHILQPATDDDGNRLAPHGREFARLLLDLVGRFGFTPASTDRAGDKRLLAAAFKDAGVKARVISQETRELRRAEWLRRRNREAVADLKAMLDDLA